MRKVMFLVLMFSGLAMGCDESGTTITGDPSTAADAGDSSSNQNGGNNSTPDGGTHSSPSPVDASPGGGPAADAGDNGANQNGSNGGNGGNSNGGNSNGGNGGNSNGGNGGNGGTNGIPIPEDYPMCDRAAASAALGPSGATWDGPAPFTESELEACLKLCPTGEFSCIESICPGGTDFSDCFNGEVGACAAGGSDALCRTEWENVGCCTTEKKCDLTSQEGANACLGGGGPCETDVASFQTCANGCQQAAHRACVSDDPGGNDGPYPRCDRAAASAALGPAGSRWTGPAPFTMSELQACLKLCPMGDFACIESTCEDGVDFLDCFNGEVGACAAVGDDALCKTEWENLGCCTAEKKCDLTSQAGANACIGGGGPCETDLASFQACSGGCQQAAQRACVSG